MDHQVFVFGSFTEEEASQFQFSSDSPCKTPKEKKTASSGRSPNLADRIPLTPDNVQNIVKTTVIASCNGSETHLADVKPNHNVGNGTLELQDEIQNNKRYSFDNKLSSDFKESTAELHLDFNANESKDNAEIPKKVLPKSWAALLDAEVDVADPSALLRHRKAGTSPSKSVNKAAQVVQVTELSGELWLQSLKSVDVVAKKRLQPRGLINKGNLCFLTATLQALISCSPFVHLLQTLHARGIPQADYPTLQACVDFFKEFELQMTDNLKGPKVSIDVGKPFLPSMFDGLLQAFNPDQPATGTARSRQEDAQEFLSFTIDHLHNELLSLQGTDQSAAKLNNEKALPANEDEDWETVGPKNKSAVVRTHNFSKSALSDIFGGDLYSIVKTKGSKASATVEPFLVLHLDILPDAVHTLEDALKLFAAPETLEGYKTMAGKAPVVSASKSIKLQSLPLVLILHLKRFSYGPQGSNKLHKPLHFPLNLTLGRDLLANTTSISEPRNYELVATVTHHGKDPSRGHYTTHSKQLDGQWLKFDDAVVSVVAANKVIQDQAYMLFYRRVVNMQ